MNLFILSLCNKECAEWMVDSHVVKILLEAVQMLSTAKRFLDPAGVDEDVVYKECHVNHPVSIWVRESYANYVWTLDLVDALHAEWKYRYNHPPDKVHKSYMVAQWLRQYPPPDHTFPSEGLTPFAQAMPNTYKDRDAVVAYRQYYMGEKTTLAKWTKRSCPPWYHLYRSDNKIVGPI
jgi:hypothetical protein